MSIVYKDPTSNPKKSIYPKDVDISRVPRTEEGDILEMILSFYAALGNRTLTSILDRFRNELEDAIKRCFKKKCFDKSTQLEVSACSCLYYLLICIHASLDGFP